LTPRARRQVTRVLREDYNPRLLAAERRAQAQERAEAKVAALLATLERTGVKPGATRRGAVLQSLRGAIAWPDRQATIRARPG
jgi:hypothetical protein